MTFVCIPKNLNFEGRNSVAEKVVDAISEPEDVLLHGRHLFHDLKVGKLKQFSLFRSSMCTYVVLGLGRIRDDGQDVRLGLNAADLCVLAGSVPRSHRIRDDGIMIPDGRVTIEIPVTLK